MNRLQVRLDEEEFGLAEAPSGTATAAAGDYPASASKSPATAPSTASEAEKQEEEKATDDVDEKKKKVIPASEAAARVTEKSEAGDHGKTDADGKSPEPATLAVVKGMSFEEKKKARAARFKMEVLTTKEDDGKSDRRKRDRGYKADVAGQSTKQKPETAGVGKDSKKQKTDKAATSYDSLTTEDLEKRLERAKKYGVNNETVDAVKAALRKRRFEGK